MKPGLSGVEHRDLFRGQLQIGGWGRASDRCTAHREEHDHANMSGMFEEVIVDKGKVRVSVSLFGRPTSVELDYLQLKGY